MTPIYRADIDGLRGVAVLSVLLFHAGMESFSGGFVGVDIFFVISGYLITTIIHREIESGSFSVARFYERRFRRILPAAVVVVLAVLVAGALLYHSEKFADLAGSAAATGVFASNIYFFTQSGYFAAPAESMPLLHTWSLAVEEQYYLFFPLLMVLIARFGGRKYTAWLVPLTLASLWACIAATPSDQAAAFYLSPMRAWELLFGSLLAIDMLPRIRRQVVRDAVSLAGFAMLVTSITQFSELTLFPGVAALVPVTGAALIIHAGAHGDTLVGRWLKWRPLVFVGLVSYSLYLWHWPIIVFTRHYMVVELTPLAMATMLAATFVMAVVSWRYVEMPFRKKRVAAGPQELFRLSAVATVLVVAASGAILWGNGLPGRYNHERVLLAAADDADWRRWGLCERRMLRDDSEPCVVGAGDERPSFILWGDSHARAMATSIDRSARRQGIAGEIAMAGGCSPLMDVVHRDRKPCESFNTATLERIASRETIRTVILASRWSFPVHGRYDMRKHGKAVPLVDLRGATTQDAGNARLFEAGLRRTIKQLNDLGKQVILVGPLPEIGYDVPSATFVALMTDRDVDAMIAPSVSEHEARNRDITAIFNDLVDEMAVARIVNPADYLCQNGVCKVAVDDMPLYRDDNHLSTFGAHFLARMFDDVLGELARHSAVAGNSAFSRSSMQESSARAAADP